MHTAVRRRTLALAICMYSGLVAEEKARNCHIYLFIYDYAVYDDSFFVVDLGCELCCTTSADLACGRSSNLQLGRQEFAVSC